MEKLIIEVRGGVVQEVYTDNSRIEIGLIDWDDTDPKAAPPKVESITKKPISALRTLSMATKADS